MIKGAGWKVSCKRAKTLALRYWIIIPCRFDILRDKFNMRIII